MAFFIAVLPPFSLIEESSWNCQEHRIQQTFLFAALRIQGGQGVGKPQKIRTAILLRLQKRP